METCGWVGPGKPENEVSVPLNVPPFIRENTSVSKISKFYILAMKFERLEAVCNSSTEDSNFQVENVGASISLPTAFSFLQVVTFLFPEFGGFLKRKYFIFSWAHVTQKWGRYNAVYHTGLLRLAEVSRFSFSKFIGKSLLNTHTCPCCVQALKTFAGGV